MSAQIRVTLVKSPYGRKPPQRKTLEALGLRRVGASRTFKESDVLRGMVRRVEHLVKVEPEKA